MLFKEYSGWNEKTELEAYLIFRKLLSENFPRGMQSSLCNEMAKKSELLDKGNISAKVSNYKSVEGINNPSNSSQATKEYYEKYKTYTINDIELVIQNMN